MKRPLLAGLCILTALFSTPLIAADTGTQALDNAFVKGVTSGDIEAVVALYAPDAILYPPGEMVAKGRDAIRAVWGGFLSANTVTECKLFETGYRTSGDTAFGWGRFSMTFQPSAGRFALTTTRFRHASSTIAWCSPERPAIRLSVSIRSRCAWMPASVR